MRFTFTGHAGQRISFKGTDDSTISTSYGSVSATLLSPSGGLLRDTADLSAFGAATELPADGTYSILVDPHAAQSGIVGLKVWDVPDDLDQDVTPSATGDTKTIELPAGGQIAHLRVHARPVRRCRSRPVTHVTRSACVVPPGRELPRQFPVPQHGWHVVRRDQARPGRHL